MTEAADATVSGENTPKNEEREKTVSYFNSYAVVFTLVDSCSIERTHQVVAPRSTRNPMAFYEFESTDYECFDALVHFAYTAR